jgi:transcriptional regulator with XRE-family HTH domain
MAQRKIHIMAVSTSELGATLRDWRERLDPGDFGVAVSSGRKAHGLRRQEVAQLSGVSVDYLIQLEQGRAKAPSPQVLTALSQALRLSNVERIHLFFLAGQSSQDSARRHQGSSGQPAPHGPPAARKPGGHLRPELESDYLELDVGHDLR